MTTLLFVHGTGVRGAAYDASFAAIRAQAAHHLGKSVDVQPCQWGDHVGATIDLAINPDYLDQFLSAFQGEKVGAL